MKELVSVEDIQNWRWEAIESPDYYEVFIAKKINQRHEEAMKERAWEAWQDSTCSLDVAYDGNEKAEETFDKWYDKKYGSDERIDKR